MPSPYSRRIPECATGATRFFLPAFLTVLAASCGLEPRDPDPMRFADAIERFDLVDQNAEYVANPIVFVGSSSIGGWDLTEYFPEIPVLNRGFGGSQISDVNHFLDRVLLKYEPSIVVFYAGENDIHAGKSPERVATDFAAFVDRVHTELPETDIIFLPMKPSPSRIHLWPEMKEGNEIIRGMCDASERLTYLDIASPMLTSPGRARPELFVEDSLHMNPSGYALWSELLRWELQRLRD